LLVIQGGELVMTGSEADLAVGEGGRFRVEVSGSKADVDAAFEKITKGGLLDEVRVEGEGPFHCVVRIKQGEPEELSRALVEAGLGLRRMQPAAAELESLFMKLTKGGEA
ncbi:MAG: hypothetical protein RL846_29610, partial [Deltaproteobacteria bacterium]